MTEFILSIAGTEAGARLAALLALAAAFAHALLGALQKGRHDPWLSRAAIDVCYLGFALPVAVFLLPWPEPHIWPVLAGAWVIHTIYKIFNGMAYANGAFTVVYPVVRGMGPLVTVIVAGVVFGETFAPLQWLGLAVLLTGIFGLSVYNLIFTTLNRETLPRALVMAVFAGVGVAAYTTYDAWGIRLSADPFTFLAWVFVVDGWLFPLVMAPRLRQLPSSELLPLFLRGLTGAFVAFFSFGSIMIATRIAEVGEAAVLRETSTVFAALIGWLVLKERVGPRRLTLMALIALGAVIVELGR